MLARPSAYHLFLDETGDHSTSDSGDIGKRYLGLTGIVLRADRHSDFGQCLELFKEKHLPYNGARPPILHRRDILYRRFAFSCLQDAEKRDAFDADLLTLIEGTPFYLIAVVLDKLEHGTKHYRHLQHPYHYCLHAMLARYCGLLRLRGGFGDVTAEARGRYEDRLLMEEYALVHRAGDQYIRDQHRARLSSPTLSIRDKRENVAGLQLADLLAYPSARDVLRVYRKIEYPCVGFSHNLDELIQTKYNRQEYQDRINGYGRVMLG